MSRDRPSKTARKVALNVISLGAKPGMEEVLPAEIVDVTARLLVASGEVGRGAVRFARSRWAVAIYEAFDWMMPGQYEAFAHRKAFCERQVRESIGSGATQVLVLGAGYDTLGWRLASEYPGVQFFEIDQPATISRKAKGIEKLGPRGNLHLIQEDLGNRRLVDVLVAVASWNGSVPSVVVAEGLTQYLEPAAVQDLFVQCGVVTGVGSRVVFTYVGAGDDGRPDVGRWTGLVMWLLRAGGEPWLWSISPEELPQFLEQAGWTYAPRFTDSSGRCGVEYHAVALK
ncbi:MAG: SAM-dependent methyltransferase [Acidobacteria bacterium]|nr:SAM-dependent methyltransferase [Acidobacteriota bacterium]